MKQGTIMAAPIHMGITMMSWTMSGLGTPNIVGNLILIIVVSLDQTVVYIQTEATQTS